VSFKSASSKPGNRRKDFIGGLGPDKGPWVFVIDANEAFDALDELPRGAVTASFEHAFRS
jgi:hypothetical protein